MFRLTRFALLAYAILTAICVASSAVDTIRSTFARTNSHIHQALKVGSSQ
jgi:hypothetical protein